MVRLPTNPEDISIMDSAEKITKKMTIKSEGDLGCNCGDTRVIRAIECKNGDKKTQDFPV
jgi:hypothetical protein